MSPIPAQDYLPEGEVDTDTLKKLAYRYITNRAIDITSENHDTFKAGNVGTPKMLLFTESKGKKPPIVYQALSSYFSVSLFISNLFVYRKLWNSALFVLLMPLW